MKKKVLIDTLGIEIAVRDGYIGVTVSAKHEDDAIYAVSGIIESPKFVALADSFEETISEMVQPTIQHLTERLKNELRGYQDFEIVNSETGNPFFKEQSDEH